MCMKKAYEFIRCVHFISVEAIDAIVVFGGVGCFYHKG